MKKLVVVIEGPGGVGKDSVIQGLIDIHPTVYKKMPSITTRKMRQGESQGSPYFFVDEKRFNQMLKAKEIFESTLHPDGTHRGMSLPIINNILDSGFIAVKDADMIGINALKTAYPGKVLTIFMKASRADVEARLRNRGGREEDIKARLDSFDEKIKCEPEFDFSVENVILSETIDKVHTIIQTHIRSSR